jgi:hypothetical protein
VVCLGSGGRACRYVAHREPLLRGVFLLYTAFCSFVVCPVALRTLAFDGKDLPALAWAYRLTNMQLLSAGAIAALVGSCLVRSTSPPPPLVQRGLGGGGLCRSS